MAALNFPNSPSLNDTHTENGVTFKWNGAAWDRLGDIGAQGSAGAAGAAQVLKVLLVLKVLQVL